MEIDPNQVDMEISPNEGDMEISEESKKIKKPRTLVGHANFVRHNPMSDRFDMKKFHHVEFWCLDSMNVSRRFTWGLGMHETAYSNMTTGNKLYASSVVQSNAITFVFTAPYNNSLLLDGSTPPHPAYSQQFAQEFIIKHGLAVRALGISVGDANIAYEKCVENGAVGVLTPVALVDKDSGKTLTISEVKLADDVVLRFVSGDYDGPFLPNYAKVDTPDVNYGLTRVDHCVTNVPSLFAQVDYMINAAGFHEFSEFTAEDVGTLDSGLNSMVGTHIIDTYSDTNSAY